MKRIAVIASSYPRFEGDGAAPFVKSIAEALQRRGHRVEVLAPYDIDVREEPQGVVKIHRFRYAWPKRLHILGHARSLKADVKLRPLVLFLLPFFLLSAIINLYRLVKRMDAQVIHAHWVLPNGLTAAIVSKLLGIPFIISLHGSDIFMADRNSLFRAVARWVFAQSAYVTACSQELHDRALKIQPAINIQLIAWGADPDLFKPLDNRQDVRAKYGWAPEEIVVTALGRLVYKKGFDRLIAVLPEIASAGVNLRVVIGGSGPLESELSAQAASLGMGAIVSFPGMIPWNEVPAFLAASDVFVLPSQRDRAGNLDGLPTVLLEAMACGLPCIASDIGGVNLVIEDGVNGFLIDPASSDSLKNALTRVLKDDHLRKELAQNSRTSVLNHFNWDQVGLHFERILDKITYSGKDAKETAR